MSMLPTDQVSDTFRRTLSRVSGASGARAAKMTRAAFADGVTEHAVAEHLAAVTALIEDGRARTARLGGAFYLAHREAAGVVDNVPALAYAGAVHRAATTPSLLVTGPVAIRRALGQGVPLEAAVATAEVLTSGSVQRQVANGARETILQTSLSDSRARAWARMSDGRPCSFCAMLISRGPVYRSAELAGLSSRSAAAYHDHCGCFIVPVYDLDAPWPGMGEKYRGLWDATSTPEHVENAATARRVFRSEYDMYYPPGSNAGANLREAYILNVKAAELRAASGGSGLAQWKGIPPPRRFPEPVRDTFRTKEAFDTVHHEWVMNTRGWGDDVLNWRRANNLPSGLQWTDDAADKVLAAFRAGDGATVHGVDLSAPTRGYVVSLSKTSELVLPTDPEQAAASLREYARKHANALSHDNVYLGGWIDDSGRWVVDVNEVIDTLGDATRIGIERDQDAIFDVVGGKVIGLRTPAGVLPADRASIGWRNGKADLDENGNLGEATTRSLDAVLDRGKQLAKEIDDIPTPDAEIQLKRAAAWEAESAYQQSQTELLAYKAKIDAEARAIYIRDVLGGVTPLQETEELQAALRRAATKARVTDPGLQARRNFDAQLFKTWQAAAIDAAQTIAKARASATMSVLQKVRPFGGSLEILKSPGGLGAKAGTAELIGDARQAQAFFPASWVEEAQHVGPITVGSSERGFTQGGLRVALSDNVDGTNRVAIHELAHVFESRVPGLRGLEWAYHYRRGSSVRAGKRSLDRPKALGGAYARNETAVWDGWRTPYSGKIYGTPTPSSDFEVMSTGVESLFAGSEHLDPEFRAFVLGVLALL